MYANENLRKWRLVRGYKQYYMGEQVNITAQAYGKIERGQTKFTKEFAIKFALALNIPLEEIYTDEHTGENDRPLTDKEREFYQKQLQDKEKIIALQDIIIQLKTNKKKTKRPGNSKPRKRN